MAAPPWYTWITPSYIAPFSPCHNKGTDGAYSYISHNFHSELFVAVLSFAFLSTTLKSVGADGRRPAASALKKCLLMLAGGVLLSWEMMRRFLRAFCALFRANRQVPCTTELDLSSGLLHGPRLASVSPYLSARRFCTIFCLRPRALVHRHLERH